MQNCGTEPGGTQLLNEIGNQIRPDFDLPLHIVSFYLAVFRPSLRQQFVLVLTGIRS